MTDSRENFKRGYTNKNRGPKNFENDFDWRSERTNGFEYSYQNHKNFNNNRYQKNYLRGGGPPFSENSLWSHDKFIEHEKEFKYKKNFKRKRKGNDSFGSGIRRDTYPQHDKENDLHQKETIDNNEYNNQGYIIVDTRATRDVPRDIDIPGDIPGDLPENCLENHDIRGERSPRRINEEDQLIKE